MNILKHKDFLSFLSGIKTILMFIILSFLFYSCIYEKQGVDSNFSYIYLDSLSKVNIIEDNIDKCQFIKLQTTDSCLIKWILKIEFDDNKIFIRDSNEKIFVFDNKGNFLNSIGKIGHGPDELLNIYDFYLDKKKKTVNICDIYKSAIFKYAYSGELLEIEKFDGKLLKNTSGIAFLDNNNLLLIQDNDQSSLFNFGILDTKRNKLKEYLPYMAVGNLTLAFGESKVASTKQFTYMCAFLSDTIYKYDNKTENIIPKWVFRGKLKSSTQNNYDGNNYDIGLDALLTAKNKHLSTGISDLYSTEKYIHFTFVMDETRFRVFFNTDSESGYYSQIVPTDIYTSFNNLIATTDKAFVCVIPVEEAFQEKPLRNSTLKQILDNTLEDDNPIIAFYYFD